MEGEVDDLGDGVRDPGHLGERAVGQHLHAVLEFQGGDDGEEVGVADPLAVAVGRALDVGGAGVHGGQGVGDGAAGVVLGVDAEPGAGVGDDRGDDGLDLGGEHAAVGVAEDDDLGARLVRGADHGLGVLGVGAVAVEEVLAVHEDPAALLAEVGDGVADHLQVLLQGGAQRQLDVPVVRLGHQRDHRGAGFQERLHLGVLGRAAAGPAGRAERHELGVLEGDLLLCAGEELRVARVGPRPAALDVPHSEGVQMTGDGQLVGDRQVDALTLSTVAQCGVEDMETVVGGRGLGGHADLTPVG